MKKIASILVLLSVVLLASPCNEIWAQTEQTTDQAPVLTANNGTSAGAALLSLYTQYKKDGKLDLQNASNISNIISLASNIKDIAKVNDLSSFVSGLISGSKNLVTSGNSGSVLNSLTSLSKLDLSSIGSSAAKAAVGGLLSKMGAKKNTSSSDKSQEVSDAAGSILTKLFGGL